MKLEKKTIAPAVTSVSLVLYGAIGWTLDWPLHYWVFSVISGVLLAVLLLKRIRAEQKAGEK